MAKKNNRVIVTGTGAVASAIVRALVPAGYDVRTIGLESRGVSAFQELKPYKPSPESVLSILRGEASLSPFIPFPVTHVPHTQKDLASSIEASQNNPFQGADIAILTAGNPSHLQDAASAERNYSIDRRSMDFALEAGVRGIFYTSSVWQTMGRAEKFKLDDPLISPYEHSPLTDYGNAKSKSVKYLESLAQKNEGVLCAYFVLGWQTHNARGAPASNVPDTELQWWLAESELQQHYILLVKKVVSGNYGANKDGKNFIGFNGISMNEPLRRSGHRPFPYNLATSVDLGVKHEFNVYDVLSKKTYDWRRIPVPES